MARDYRQVNFRVDPETEEVLEAVVFIERRGSIADLVSDVVAQYVASRRGDRDVREAIGLRVKQEAKATVSSLAGARKRGRARA